MYDALALSSRTACKNHSSDNAEVKTYKKEMHKAEGIGAAEAHAIDHLQA
jgi:hypothetical protein